jgi:hypothetical protein
MFDGGLGGEQETEYVYVEDLVEVRFGDGLNGGEFVNAGVVDEDIQAAESFDGCFDELLRIGGLGDIATDCDGFASVGGYGGDYDVRASFAGGVVDHHGGAFGGERFGDGGSDTLGCAGDDCDFTFKLAHADRIDAARKKIQ